jgi:ATP-dependent helicase/DNAse subunit B
MKDTENRNITLFPVPLNYRGITTKLLKEALKEVPWPDYSQIIYIAPTPRKLRDAQKIFHALVKNPYIPPRFFTLKQYAQHLFEKGMSGTVLPQIMVPLIISQLSDNTIGYANILSELLRELKQHHPSRDLAALQEELSDLFGKLGIPEDATGRMHAAFDVYEQYQSLISASGYFDQNDVLNHSSSVLSRHIGAVDILIVDGFYDMTISERNLFSELVRHARMSIASFPHDIYHCFKTDSYYAFLKNNFNIKEVRLEPNIQHDNTYIKYSSPEEEVEGVARNIKNLFVSGRLSGSDWIVVTFPHLSGYRNLTERIFRRYGLPFSVSLQRSPVQKGPIRDLLKLLDSIADDFPRQAFTSFLNSPYFKNIPELLKKSIPYLSFTSGIIKGKESWQYLGAGARTRSDQIDDALSRIFSHLERLIRIKDSAVPLKFQNEIDKALSALGWEATQEDKDLLDTSFGKVNIITELSGSNVISLRRLTDSMRHILSAEEYIGEEPGIQIMDFLETRGLEPDYLYFCGLKDGDMPSRPPLDHVLPDSVRTEYGLINLNAYLSVQKLNFLRIINASKNVHLSFPEMDGERLFLPSPFLPWDREMTEQVPGIFSHAEKQIGSGRHPFTDSIREISLKKNTLQSLLAKKLRMPYRVTDIDAFRMCPRRFFIEKILKLESTDISEYEIEPKLLGTIIHAVMEELLKERVTDIDSLRKRADLILDNILKRHHVETYLKKLVKESFLEILPEIFEIETGFRDEGFQPHELEMSLEESVLPDITLKGKIDRIDKGKDLFRIMDYKTGTATIGSGIITKGKDLQLPLYAAMLASRGFPVEKAGIYSLKDPGVKWIPTQRDRHTMDTYIGSSLTSLEGVVDRIRRGNFDADPVEEFYCTKCPENPFCPYIHTKGTADAG